jgi:hypothetical protein
MPANSRFSAAPTPDAPYADDEFRLARAAIEVHGEELAAYPGVISVRPGYRLRRGRITREPAVIVSVLRKKDVSQLDSRDLLPRRLGKVAVDIVPASPHEQLRAARKAEASLALPEAVGVVARLAAQRGVVDLRTPLEREEAEEPAFGPEALREEYPRPDRELEEVDEEMTLICHASPDAGWRLLREFLEGTQQNLTATMYEFTARHILEKLVEVLQPPKTFHFVMDHETDGSGLNNPEALEELAGALGDRLKFAWAPVAQDNVTTVGFFPSAYHIKVAVRDGEAVWLSSGNWKPSGQPKVDPFDPPPDFNAQTFQKKQNREWHVIAESPGLAEQFEFFIDYDLEQALPLQVESLEALPAPGLPDLFVPERPAELGLEVAVQFFEELKLTKRIRIRPLLTPDNFIDHILPLVQNAQRRVWFQNQSLRKPDPSKPRYKELFQTLRDHSQNSDIDARIIVRGDFDPFEVTQALQQSGYNMERVRLQDRCHTKGLIIDDLAVVVGSHNWSGHGTLENRDASLIIHDPEAISYYEELFSYDWERVASEDIEALESMPLLTPPDVPAPEGMHRVSWGELFE